MTVLLEYINGFYNFQQMHKIDNNVFYILSIMLALWLILAMTHYAHNYASSIIGGSLNVMHSPQKNHHVE